MSRPLPIILFLLATGPHAHADVFSYEDDSLPQDAKWEIVSVFCDPELWVADSVFGAHVDLCDPFPPPGGQQAAYKRFLDEFLDKPKLFIEWRVETDADRSEIPWGGGAALAVANSVGVRYTFFIAGDQVKLNRDNTLPIIIVDIAPGIPHIHRLELYGDELYIWYIDGEIVDSGIPEGLLPMSNPRITWVTSAKWLPNTTSWDYIRYGVIPIDQSGDFDSDDDVGVADFYYSQECLDNGGPNVPAGPGCHWADMDADTDVDFHDFALFQRAATSQ